MKKIVRNLIILAVVICLSGIIFLNRQSASDETYKSGTYTVSEQGYGGEVVVEVIFDQDKITGIQVLENNETAGIGDTAIKELPEIMIAAQSYEVDAVSTATVTSEAMKAAVKDCMEQAKLK